MLFTALQVLLIPKYIPQLTMLSHANCMLFRIAKVVALLLLLANLAHQKITAFLGRRSRGITSYYRLPMNFIKIAVIVYVVYYANELLL